MNVEAGSPADKGGLMLGDLLVLVGDQPVIDVDSLRAQLTSDKLDQAIAIRILRGGEVQNLTITLGERKITNLFPGPFPTRGGVVVAIYFSKASIEHGNAIRRICALG